jgi:hypothetical protein
MNHFRNILNYIASNAGKSKKKKRRDSFKKKKNGKRNTGNRYGKRGGICYYKKAGLVGTDRGVRDSDAREEIFQEATDSEWQ